MQGGKDESCPADFLAPFLQRYKFAQKHVYLTQTRQARHRITLPKEFLKNDPKKPENRLFIALDRVAEPDVNGSIVPVSTSGSRFSYTLSPILFLLNFDKPLMPKTMPGSP